MRHIILFSLLFLSSHILAQSLEFVIEWEDRIEYEVNNIKVDLPNSKNFDINYSFKESFKLVKQWEESKLIDPQSVRLIDVKFSEIDFDEYSGLDKINFPDNFDINFNSSISKNIITSYLEISPIIYSEGQHRKIESFSFQYDYLNQNKKLKTTIQSSVLRSGQWYQFFY